MRLALALDDRLTAPRCDNPSMQASIAWLWSHRRWAYAAYMLFGVLRIPERTGFHFYALKCDTRLTAANAGASMTKGPHIVLFALFFLLTAAQFDRVDRRSMGWSLAATLALGLLVEIEEGLTRTGNCRLTDVLPDVAGGAAAMAVLASGATVWRFVSSARNQRSQQ